MCKQLLSSFSKCFGGWIQSDLLNFIFYQYGRSNVECAGFCLSLQTCHAFRWIGSNDEQPNNICQRLDKDSVCLTSGNNPIEIYVDSNENFSDCAGLYELNCSQLAVLSSKTYHIQAILYSFIDFYIKSTVN